MARLSAPRGICLLKGMDSAIVNMKPTDEVEVLPASLLAYAGWANVKRPLP